MFARKGISKLRYVSRADEGADERADEGADEPADERADEPADSNDKGEVRRENENQESTIPTGTSELGTMSPSGAVKRKTETRVAISAPERAMAHSGGTVAHRGAMVPNGSEINTHSDLQMIEDVDAALNAFAQKEAA